MYPRGLAALVMAVLAVASCGDGGGAGDRADAALGVPDAALGSPDAAGQPDAATKPLPAARPVGVNMPFLFHMYLGLGAGGPEAARHQMDLAAARGFSHARVIATPYWAGDMKAPNGWVTSPSAYFAAFDALARDARSRGLHLVPSLLWQSFLFPDLAGEPRGQLFVPGSATRMLAERFITEFVERYKDDDTILFWEIGNEWNLGADLDTTCDACSSAPACAQAAQICVDCGTPCKRTGADNYYSCNECRGVSSAQEDLRAFSAEIAALIHGLDPTRLVSSGNGLPRFSAYHLSHQAGDYTADTPEQFETALLDLHPDGVDLISIHMYPEGPDVSPARFGDSDLAGVALLARVHALALQKGKKLYVGEYGEVNGGSATCGGNATACGGDPSKWYTRRVLDAIVREGVEYAGLWAYEAYLDASCPLVPTCYTVTDSDPFVATMVTHERAYGSCTGAADGAGCPAGSCQGGQCVPPLTPPPTAPTSLAHLTFSTANDTSGWIVFTNCSGCQPGTLTVDGGSQLARLASHDLPCTGDCAYPGAYAVAPLVPVQAGHLSLRFSARSSSAQNRFDITVLDGQMQTVGYFRVAVATTTQPGQNGVTFELPDGAATVSVMAAALAADSTIDIGSIDLEWQPSP